MNSMNYKYHIPIIIFLALLSSIPILGLDYPHGHDWLYELVRVAEYKSALGQSQYPPYWAENLYGGLGSPIFMYYAPLYSFISSGLSSITGQIDSAAALTLIASSLAGLVFMSLFLHELLNRYNIKDERAIRVGLYLYGLSPYLMADKLIRNASAEFLALSLAPLALYGLILIHRKPRIGSLILSLGIALTILSHNLTALIIFAISLLAIVLIYLKHKEKLVCALGSLILGLCISMFFWLPALYYKSLVRTNLLITGKFDFHSQFKDFIQYFGSDEFYSVGPLPIILVILATIVCMRYIRNRNHHILIPAMVFTLFLAAIFIFLQLSVSSPLWEYIPFLELFQFPWRMMGPLALVTAVIATLLFAYPATPCFRGKKRVVELIILCACLLSVELHLSKVSTLPRIIDVALPEFLTADSIQQKLLPATVLDEYLPKDANHKLLSKALSDNRPIYFSVPINNTTTVKPGNDRKENSEYTDADHMANRIRERNPVFSHSDSLSITTATDHGESILLNTSSKSPGVVHFTRWYHPVWHAQIDGSSVNVFADDQGLLTVQVPSGSHKLEITKAAPLLRQYTLLISITSVALWLLMVMIPFWRSRL